MEEGGGGEGGERVTRCEISPFIFYALNFLTFFSPFFSVFPFPFFSLSLSLSLSLSFSLFFFIGIGSVSRARPPARGRESARIECWRFARGADKFREKEKFVFSGSHSFASSSVIVPSSERALLWFVARNADPPKRDSRPVLARASSGIRGWFGRSRIRHLRHWPLDAVKLGVNDRSTHPSVHFQPRGFITLARNASSRAEKELRAPPFMARRHRPFQR